MPRSEDGEEMTSRRDGKGKIRREEDEKEISRGRDKWRR